VKAVERFLLRVNGLLQDRRQTQKSLRGDKTEGWISNIMRERRALKLNDADELAETLGVPLAELVRRPDDRTYELTGTEARVIEAFRRLSPTEQQAAIALLTLRQRKVGRPPKNESKKIVNRN
jgi:hypothetical protein